MITLELDEERAWDLLIEAIDGDPLAMMIAGQLRARMQRQMELGFAAAARATLPPELPPKHEGPKPPRVPRKKAEAPADRGPPPPPTKFAEGYSAYGMDIPVSRNPHQADSDEGAAWATGWQSAAAQDGDE